MTNKTIDGVSRELLERVVKADASQGANAIQLCDGWNAMVELRKLLAAPVVERQEPVCHIVEFDLPKVMSGEEINVRAWHRPSDGSEVTKRIPLYTAPPQLAELQAEIERLKATTQRTIDQTIPLVPDENNPMWSRRITIDELQATIERQAAEIALLREFHAAAEARAELSKKIKAAGMPPHADYWCQSIHYADKRVDDATAALNGDRND